MKLTDQQLAFLIEDIGETDLLLFTMEDILRYSKIGHALRTRDLRDLLIELQTLRAKARE